MGYVKVQVTTNQGHDWWVGQGQGSKLHLISAQGLAKGQTACGGQRNFGAGIVLLPEGITADQVSERLCARCYAKIEAAISRGAVLTMTTHAWKV